MQNNTVTTNSNSRARRTSGRLAQIGLVGVVVAGVGAFAGASTTNASECALTHSPGFTGGVVVAVGDVDGDAADYVIWRKTLGTSAVADPSSGVGTDSLSFGVEREMKESGEKGGTEDINIGVGELQECTISKSMDTSTPVYGDAGEQTYLKVELENVQITSYQVGVLDTAHEGHGEWIEVLSYSW